MLSAETLSPAARRFFDELDDARGLAAVDATVAVVRDLLASGATPAAVRRRMTDTARTALAMGHEPKSPIWDEMIALQSEIVDQVAGALGPAGHAPDRPPLPLAFVR